ncbi:MAG: TlpA family protein disulfide reductase, partial [Burkholderiales bacterium]|nr:TlpA family protein disulfide reductase [Burkholderiales bacterium]
MLAALLLLALFIPQSRDAETATGAELPSVALSGLSGESPTSTDAMRGAPLIINFWATWCGPCREEMQSLELLSHRLSGSGVRVIGIATDRDLNLAAEFVRERRLTFPMYADGPARQLQSMLRVRSLPETLLVSADGVILARILGARDWNGIKSDRL